MDKILKQFGEQKITDAVRESNSFVEATSYLGLDKKVSVRRNVERSIKRLGLSTEHFESVKRVKDSKSRWNEERISLIVKNSNNYKEILEKLDILPIYNNYKKLKGAIYRFKIDTSHLKNLRTDFKKSMWTEESLSSVIKESKNQKEVLEKMKIRDAGGNYSTLQKYIKLYNLDTSHFTKCYDKMINFSINKKIPLYKILTENSSYGRNHLKNRLYKEGLKTKFCELCGQGEEWNGKHMSLILDHINGIHNDNRIENLRIVCPNCNATLDTHCGRNTPEKIKKIKEQKKLNIEKSFISKRKVNRPPFEELKMEVKSLGLEGVGRKYGVTGNSIKKWIKTYEKYGK